jgi:hypothetical protein
MVSHAKAATATPNATPDAIVGTGRASGGSADAIVGTGRASGGATDAIVGTGRASGGATDAIIGTGRTSGGATDAIVGTGRASGGATDAIIGTGAADSLVFLGPVQSFDFAESSVTVLGRKLLIPASNLTADVIQALCSGDAQLAVLGRLTPSGSLKGGQVRVLANKYVAGASPIVVSGVLKAIDQAFGRARIGNVLVDFTAVLADNQALPAIGSVIVAVGIEAQAGLPVTLVQIKTYGAR